MPRLSLRSCALLLLALFALSLDAGAEDRVDATCEIALQASVSGEGAQHVVLLGGLSASPDEWTRTRDSLQADYTVHVVSIPGLGGVPLPGKSCDVDVEDVADAMGRYIEREAAPGKTAVVGHSAGGLATLQLAGVRGELVSGIVAIDALPFMSANFGANAVDDALQARIHDEYREILAEPQSKFAERMRTQAQGSVVDPAVAARIATVAANSDRRTYASLYSSTMLTDLRGLRPPREMPVFVLFADQASHGAPPGFMRKRYAGQYAWLAPERMLEVAQSRHYVMLDQPDTFTRLLRDALQSMQAAAKRDAPAAAEATRSSP